MILTVASLLLLAASSAAVPGTPTFHLDDRIGVFELSLTLPDNGVPTRYSVQSSDEKLFLMHVEQMEVSPTVALERELVETRRELVAAEAQLSKLKSWCASVGSNPKASNDQTYWNGESDLRPKDCKKAVKEGEGRDNRLKSDVAEKAARAQSLRNKPEGIRLTVVGRFQGQGSAAFNVVVESDKAPATTVPLAFALPRKPVANRPVVARWWAAEAADLERRSAAGGDALARYALAVMPEHLGLADGSEHRRAERLERQAPDLFSVMTGQAAVLEALQFDGVRAGMGDTEKATVPLASLEPPSIESHDFDQLRGTAEAAGFEAAEAIPGASFAVHFTSPTAAFRVLDLAEDWGTDIAHGLEGFARGHRTQEHFVEQLALPRDALTRLYADHAIETISLTGHDPFVRDGTDLTLVLQVKEKDLVVAAIEGNRARALEAHADAAQTTTVYSGAKIRSLATPDRTLSSVYAVWGGYVFVGNSIEGVKACLDAVQGTIPSLAKAPDFKYLRTVMSTDGDAFVYLSDAFVRSVVSPRWKIAAFRRTACAAQLEMIEFGRLLAQRDHSKATTLDELVREGWVPKKLTCPHGGHYDLDAKGAHCSVHGQLTFLTPLAELPFDSATAVEAGGYRTFVENYREYWRRYIDPVGVRLKLGPTIEAETIILPLVEDSIYKNLAAAFAQNPTTLEGQGLSDKSILSISGALKDPDSREWLSHSLFRSLERTGIMMDEWLGDQASLVVYDGDPSLTVSSTAPMTLMQEGGGAELSLFLSAFVSAISMPSALVVQVRDGAKAERVLAMLATAWGGGRSQEESIASYSLQDATGGTRIRVLTFKLFGIALRLYYTTVGNQLFVSTRPWLVDEMLARGSAVSNASAPAEPGHLRIHIEHGHMKAALAGVRAGWAETMREACLKNLVDLDLVHQATGGTDLAGDVQAKLSYQPYCPSGGHYLVGHDGHVACSAHGTAGHPSQPGERSGTRSAQWLDRFDDIDLMLTFTPEGLRTKVRLTPRPR
jgi:hypothetical protein